MLIAGPQVRHQRCKLAQERGEALDELVLACASAGLGQRSVVVVAGGDIAVRIDAAATGPEAKVRPAVEHVEVEHRPGGGHFDQPAQHVVGALGRFMLAAPRVEPARPELRHQARGVRLSDAQLTTIVQQMIPSVPAVDRARHLLPEVVAVDDGDLASAFAQVAVELLAVAFALLVVAAEPLVLVLDDDDGSAAGRLEPADLIHHRRQIPAARLQKRPVRLAQLDILDLMQPGRQPAEVPLGTDIRPGPKYAPHALLSDQLHEPAQVRIAFPPKHARLRLVQVPEDVGFDAVKPRLFGRPDALTPQLVGGAGVVDRGADQPDPPPVNHEALTVVGDARHIANPILLLPGSVGN